MRKVVEDCTVPSQEASQQVTSILSGQRKVCYLSCLCFHLHLTTVNPGWAPSTFKSSRSERAKAKAARPEDFMDEEDMSELRDGQKLVDTTDEMDVDFWERGRKKGMEVEGQECVNI